MLLRMWILLLAGSLLFSEFGTDVKKINQELKKGQITTGLQSEIESLKPQTDVEKSLKENLRGQLFLLEKKYDEAIDCFDEGIDLDSKNAENHYWRGKAYLAKLREASFIMKGIYSSKSLSSFEKAVELNPKHILARVNLGGFYANAPSIAGGDKDKAKEQFQAVLKLNDKIAYAYFMLGKLAEEDENKKEAISFYQKAVKLDPENKSYKAVLNKADKGA